MHSNITWVGKAGPLHSLPAFLCCSRDKSRKQSLQIITNILVQEVSGFPVSKGLLCS